MPKNHRTHPPGPGSHLDLAALRAQVDRDRLTRHLERCAGIRRDTGGPGEEQMISYIVDTLEGDGIPVHMHDFDAYLSYPRNAVLEVVAPEQRQLTCITHAFARSSGPGGLIGKVKAVASNEIHRAAGRIALVEGLAMPITVLEASRVGALGVIFINADWYLHNMIVTTIWGGAPTPEQIERLPAVPVVSIAQKDGRYLHELLARGPVDVRLGSRVDTGWYPSKLPEVVVPGRGEDPAFVLTGGHYCAWEVGITDNSTGVAVLLELARVLWQQRERLQRSVRIAWWPGHSHGRYAGSTWYADTFFDELAHHAVAYHNIDSPGVRGASKYILRHTTAELEAFGRQTIEQFTAQRDPEVHRPSRSADQSFLANGVPSCSLYSFLPDDHPDRKPWTGGCAGAWWWHTEHDTLDKADPEVLTADCQLSLAFVAAMADRPLLPYDIEAACNEIAAFVRETDDLAGEHLSLAATVTRAEHLLHLAGHLRDLDGVTAAEHRQRINAGLLRLTRLLLPLVYTRDGRYQHEAANVTPIMRTQLSSLFPGLNPARRLGELGDRNAYGFLLTDLRRQRNRFDDRLAEASNEIAHLLEELGLDRAS